MSKTTPILLPGGRLALRTCRPQTERVIRALGWGLLAGVIHLACQLPLAVVWSVEQVRYGTPALPSWTPPIYYWSYDSLLWSTTILGAALAGLVVRRWSALAGVAVVVILGAVGELPAVLSGRIGAAGLAVGVGFAMLATLGCTGLTVFVAQWRWGRLLVLAGCLPAFLDQIRLVDLAASVSGWQVRPSPSETLLAPGMAALALAVVLGCSGLAWFGARADGVPGALLVGLGASAAALFVGVPLRLWLLDATATVVGLWQPDPGRRPVSAGAWLVTPRLIGSGPWLFAGALLLGVLVSLLLRRVAWDRA